MKFRVGCWFPDDSVEQILGPKPADGLYDVTPEQTLRLFERFDVMLTHGREGSQPALWLDERGGRFRQR